MNHLPFKEWLLSEEPLTQEQNQVFQEHLRGCAECQQAQASWSEVQKLVKRTPEVAPTAGFTNRWQNRLAARQAKRQRLQLRLALAAGILLASVLILFLGVQLSGLLQSPAQFILKWAAQLASLFVFVSSVSDYLTAFTRSFPLIPFVGLVLSVGMISLLCVLWLTAVQQLVVARRFVK